MSPKKKSRVLAYAIYAAGNPMPDLHDAQKILDKIYQQGYDITQIPNNTEDIQEIVKVWNAQHIIVHKRVDKKMQSVIRSILKEYSIDEIKESIENYAAVLHDKKYLFSYKWRLEEFLQRGIRRFSNESDPLNNSPTVGTSYDSGGVTPPAPLVSPTLRQEFLEKKKREKNGL